MDSIKIIRTYWGQSSQTLKELPPFPLYPKQELVYVWGEKNFNMFKEKGYEAKLISESLYPYFNSNHTQYGKKLVALKLALEEFDEVLMLDWDCYILRPLDTKFNSYLQSKPTQCPLYTQHRYLKQSLIEAYLKKNHSEKELKEMEKHIDILEEGFSKYHWKWDEGLVTPNFGAFYTRDKKIGDKLLNIALKYQLQGCIEEHAFQIYSNCTLEEYLIKYQPLFVQGVSQEMTNHDLIICKIQSKLNKYIDSKLSMDLYLKHM